MTAILGFNLQHYVMLVADTRVTYVDGTGLSWYDDNEPKIQRTTMGLVTGMGLARQLDLVKDTLAKEQVEDTDQIVAIMRRSQATALQWWPGDQGATEAIMKITSWMLSYVHCSDQENLSSETVTMRLAFAQPSEDYRFGLCGAPKGIMGPTPGISPELEARLRSMAGAGVKAVDNPDDLTENIHHHADLARTLMRLIADASPSVSRRIQFGIHTLRRDTWDHSVHVTPIQSLDG